MLKRNLAPFKELRFARAITGALLMTLSCWLGADMNLGDAEKAIRLQQFNRAFSLYYKAAEAGDSEAQFQLANLYSLGKGVAKSEHEAQRWLEKSANLGNAGAQFALAMSLIKTDSERALALLHRSADANYAPALTYLSQIENQQPAPDTQKSDPTLEHWFAAVKKNQISQLDAFVKSGIGVNSEDKFGRTAIFYAIENKSKSSLEWLLNHGANVDFADQFGDRPLFFCIANKQEAFFNLLLKKADIQQLLPNGDSLLHYSVRRKQQDVIRRLLQKDVSLNRKNKEGWTALDLAEFSGQEDTVTLLKAHGATRGIDWQALGSGNQSQALIQQYRNQKSDPLEVARIILSKNNHLLNAVLSEQKMDLNQPLSDDSTLLSVAVKSGNAGAVTALLTSGARLAKKSQGESVLHIAAAEGECDIALHLLAAGADPLVKNQSELDAVESAVYHDQSECAVQLLEWMLAHKLKAPINRYLLSSVQKNNNLFFQKVLPLADKIEMDKQNRNVFWYAAKNCNPAMTKQLAKFGSEQNAADDSGKIPLVVAIESGCYEVTEILLSGANLNQKTLTGNTPLMIASAKADEPSVKLLLQKGADVNERNTLGNTALIAAVETDSVAIVKLLVDAGANVNRKNAIGLSAIDIAEGKKSKVLDALRERAKLF